MSTLYKDNYTLQKPKSYNKNCWSLIYNMNYGLKSRLHKSQIYNNKKIHSGLAVPPLELQSLTRVRSDPLLKVDDECKRFGHVELYFPSEAKVDPRLGEQLYHISSVDAESVSSFL